MLNLLRKLRRKNMKSTYIKYAVGEIILVVLGILIALSINNWNEQRKEKAVRDNLIDDLKVDLEETLILVETTENTGNRMKWQMEEFFRIMQNESDYSIDSIRLYMLPFFQGLLFEPQLSALTEAENTGQLHLIENRKFFLELTNFKRAFNSYRLVGDQLIFSYTNGSLWEFRKTIGFMANVSNTVNAYGGYEYQEMSFEEYQKLYKKPLTQSALETSYVFVTNNLNDLSEMKESIIQMVEELDKAKR